MNDLRAEWITEWESLQNLIESSERQALWIKLIAVILTGVALLSQTGSLLSIILLVAVLWLLEAIWKTFQGRMSARLLQVEQALAGEGELLPLQFNRQWEDLRPGTLGLIVQYAKQALRPTIMLPYPLLMALLCWVDCL